MKSYEGAQTVKQLEKRKGGYFYLKIDSEIVNQFSKKKATRMICTLDHNVSYRCGLNHLGDGNFYIIIAGKYLKELQKVLGKKIQYKIEEDPDQLGVEMPEVLSVFLEQDVNAKETFGKLTDGKKRSLIYSVIKIKDLDKQIKIITDFIVRENTKHKKS